MEKINLKIPDDSKPIRIDKYISEQLPQLSRSRIQQFIEQGFVNHCGNRVTRTSEKIVPGECYEITLPPPEPSDVLPQEIPIPIVYQDASIALVNKPPGMSVHPTETKTTDTLVNALLFHIKDLSGIGGVLRPGIVHRLDRVTSGILIVAKNDEAHHNLSAQFKNREVKKIYWALVHGTPIKANGEVNLAIGRHPSDRKRMAPLPNGRSALTRYKTIKEGLGGSWLELYPVTGRTHQIRVHLKHLGCPVIRDTLYGSRKTLGRGQLERLFENYPGIALHARSIEFRHPCRGETMAFEAPLPKPFAEGLEKFL